MSVQKIFNYKFNDDSNNNLNFFVNSTNDKAFEVLTNNYFSSNIFLYGPSKSGKSHLVSIWVKQNNAILFDNNFKDIINTQKNILIEDINYIKNEEEIFHIINHCKLFNLKISITSSVQLNDLNLKLKDLHSRLKSFYYIKINHPDDEMFKMIMTKLFYEKQIIIKNKEIFEYIFNRIDRTYEEIYSLIEKLDQLSLEKKRQLTIPLIKEIL